MDQGKLVPDEDNLKLKAEVERNPDAKGFLMAFLEQQLKLRRWMLFYQREDSIEAMVALLVPEDELKLDF